MDSLIIEWLEEMAIKLFIVGLGCITLASVVAYYIERKYGFNSSLATFYRGALFGTLAPSMVLIGFSLIVKLN
jgi:hypothetical protein